MHDLYRAPAVVDDSGVHADRPRDHLTRFFVTFFEKQANTNRLWLGSQYALFSLSPLQHIVGTIFPKFDKQAMRFSIIRRSYTD